jgi:hypothetical protein
VAALVAAPGMHHQWSRYAKQFRDNLHHISEALIEAPPCLLPPVRPGPHYSGGCNSGEATQLSILA